MVMLMSLKLFFITKNIFYYLNSIMFIVFMLQELSSKNQWEGKISQGDER